MEFIRLNKGWNAEPNAPNPQIDIIQDNLVLSFLMNPYQYDGYKDGDIGFILFKNVFKYRLGSPNEEGFYKGQFRYKRSQVDWGELYKVENSDYFISFPADCEVINPELTSENNLKHYIFFFRDNTFECVANSYKLFVSNNYTSYCPYCRKVLKYNGKNFFGIECGGEYSIKMSQRILIKMELEHNKNNQNEIKTLSKYYCPRCSRELYGSKLNGLLCLECGFHFTNNEFYQLIEWNPHT